MGVKILILSLIYFKIGISSPIFVYLKETFGPKNLTT